MLIHRFSRTKSFVTKFIIHFICVSMSLNTYLTIKMDFLQFCKNLNKIVEVYIKNLQT